MDGGERDEPLGTGQGAGQQIGSLLEKKRIEKGLSLKDVEDATKIRTRYIEGLEREDYTMLPDHIYARGFLKTYANFLGLDGERLAREFKDLRSPRRERQFNHEAPARTRFDQPLTSPLGGGLGAERRRFSGITIITAALALIALVAVVGALYYVGARSLGGAADTPKNPPEPAQSPAEPEDPAPSPDESPGTTAAAPAEPAPTEETTQAETAPETVRATVKVADLPAGLTIRADGQTVLDQFAQPGFSQTFEARDLLVVETTNAGAVEVVVDGENAAGRLGGYGQPATREFRADPGG